MGRYPAPAVDKLIELEQGARAGTGRSGRHGSGRGKGKGRQREGLKNVGGMDRQ